MNADPAVPATAPTIWQPHRPGIGRAERAANIVRALRRADDTDIAGPGFGAHHGNITDRILTSCK